MFKIMSNVRFGIFRYSAIRCMFGGFLTFWLYLFPHSRKQVSILTLKVVIQPTVVAKFDFQSHGNSNLIAVHGKFGWLSYMGGPEIGQYYMRSAIEFRKMLSRTCEVLSAVFAEKKFSRVEENQNWKNFFALQDTRSATASKKKHFYNEKTASWEHYSSVIQPVKNSRKLNLKKIGIFGFLRILSRTLDHWWFQQKKKFCKWKPVE